MWIMMGIEQPAITAVIARLGFATTQLAAFGVSFAFALVIESPIIQLLSTGTALVPDREHYRRILNFTHVLCGAIVFIHILLVITPAYELILRNLMNVPEELIDPSKKALVILIPWAPAVAYRRYWQGILIRFGRTAVVPLTMIFRVVSIAIVLAAALIVGTNEGAAAGALALTVGVVSAAAAAYIFVRPVIRDRMPERSEEPALSAKGFLAFYVPLALTSVVALSARPLLTVGIARAPDALSSLAVWPVIMGYLFLFNSTAIAYQEVVISMIRLPGAEEELTKFTAKLAVTLAALFGFTALTPIWQWWFSGISGLSGDLLIYVEHPLWILTATPILVAGVAWFRGRQVYRRNTVVITQAVGVNTVFMISAVLILAHVTELPGATSAAIAFAGALGVETLFLRYRTKKPISRNRSEGSG